MRLLKQFAIAITPFILNAELVKIPEIQEPSIFLNIESTKPLPIQENPLILQLELPQAVQEAAVITNNEEPAATTTPVATNNEESAVHSAEVTPVGAKNKESTAPPAEEVSISMSNHASGSSFQVMRVNVRHTEAKGVGYKEGYTTFEGFGMHDDNSYFMPFIDLRGHIFNDGKLAGNFGIGERTFIPSINHLFGFYCYYDVRQEDHRLTVNQISPGLELLGKRMEYRINAYFPVGKHETPSYDHKFSRFSGHHVLIKEKKKYALTGVDGEIGTHFTQSSRHDLYAGMGPYYFTADPFSAWGGKARLLWRYKEYISLEASYSYDHLFKNVFQGTFGFSYPFGRKLKNKDKKSSNCKDLVLSRAAFAPYRFEIPVIKRDTKTTTAINPTTGQPLQVWFVDNTSNSAGTYESPFPTLAEAQNISEPNDMIYVFPGDGTSKGMNEGINLKNGQMLFGSGATQTIQTTLGKVTIPTFSATAPTVTGSGNYVVTLANGNEISGMNLIAVSNAAIGAIAIDAASFTNGVNIHNNFINTTSGVGLEYLGFGSIIVENNHFIDKSITNQDFGLLIAIIGDQDTNINISNNIITGYSDGIGLGPILPNNPNCSYDAKISGNLISGFAGSGILLENSLNSTLKIINNRIFDTISSGGTNEITGGIAVKFATPSNSSKFYIHNNTVVTTTPVAANSISVQSIVGAGSGRVSIKGNTVVAGLTAGSYGLNIDRVATTTLCTTITNNQILATGTSTNGMRISGGAGTINIDDFSNNIAPNVIISGNVNLVAPNTCQP